MVRLVLLEPLADRETVGVCAKPRDAGIVFRDVQVLRLCTRQIKSGFCSAKLDVGALVGFAFHETGRSS